MEDIINEKIKLKYAILIDENGKNLGNQAVSYSLSLAYERKLDLVLVSPGATGRLGVVKIMDYHKQQYQKRKNIVKVKPVVTKEIQFGVEIATHDLETRANMARKWIEKGNVRIMVRVKMTGRMVAVPQYAFATFNTFVEMLKDIVVIDKAPTINGRDVIAYLSATKNK